MPSLSAAVTESHPYKPQSERKVNTSGLRPYQPGVSGNPGGRTKLETEIRKLAQGLSAEAMERCGQIMRQTDDPRAALIASGMILDRAYGKPKEMTEDTRKALVDVAHLGPERLALLSALLREAMRTVEPADPNVTDVPVEQPTPDASQNIE